MFLLDWYEQYLEIKNNQKIKDKELLYCEACETLKLVIASKTEECKMLIEKLTADKTVVEEVVKQPENLRAVMPTSLRWGARAALMEANDREKAKILRAKEKEIKAAASQKGVALTEAEIEKELGVEANG